MHLKVLLVPSLVIMTLVLAIGFIRPALADLGTKQAEFEAVAARLEAARIAAGNIDALGASLDSRSDAEVFVKQYLPEKMDQDRPMDALNFLASQSGVTLSNMEFTDVKRVEAVPVDMTIDPAVAAEAAAFAEPIPETYVVSATVRGSYENIKTFFTRASRMDRLHDVSSFSIEVDEARVQTPDGPAIDPASDLIGTFTANFPYFAGRPAIAVVSAPLFQQAEIDFAPITAAIEKSSEAIPSLERPQSGRSNPFR